MSSPTVGLAWVQGSGEDGTELGLKYIQALGGLWLEGMQRTLQAGLGRVGKGAGQVLSGWEIEVLTKQEFPSGVGWENFGALLVSHSMRKRQASGPTT